MLIRFGKNVTSDYNQSSHLEWLLANELGSYSSSSVAGANTRRYHGLLVTALNPPAARTMLLQKIEETLTVDDHEYRLSVNEYPGTLYPSGHECLEEFRLDPYPVFRYRIGDAVLEKEIGLVSGENTVIVKYSLLESRRPVHFTADMLVNYRAFHSMTRENPRLRFRLDLQKRLVKVMATDEAVPFYLHSDRADFRPTGHWYRNFVYAEERERGYDYMEDTYSPGQFSVEMNNGDYVNLVGSLSMASTTQLDTVLSQQKDAVRNQRSGSGDDFLRDLLISSSTFLVRRGDGETCIAGYHWFGDWGRDAMISLPGLALVTGRYRAAESILKTFAKNMRFGLIPNYFSETDGTPQYNSVDATLWFFHATRKYLQYTHDLSTVKALYPAMKESIKALLHGTAFGIEVDDGDMLIELRRNDLQLTWMDAKIDSHAVTPRNGKPVEVNALWQCALDSMKGFAALVGERNDQASFADLADRVKKSFAKEFWNPEDKCLFDRIVDETPDASLRPNQVIAVALPERILAPSRERAVVKAVYRDLLTPFGLRTLSPKDPNYVGCYVGDERGRNLAYHQGSAWPWLLGPFVKAYVRTSSDIEGARRDARKLLEPIRGHLSEAGIGYISELFDGDLPQQPRGCIAQAWSVAEVLRAYYEDILGKEPRDILTS